MDKLHRCYGPPGTGKTTWLSRQARAAAEKYGSRGVLVASLTRAAAVEVAGRDTGLHREQIGTLHAHAFRALDRPQIAEDPKRLREWNEQAHLAWRVQGADGASSDDDRFDAAPDRGEEDLLQTLGTLRARLAPRESWPPRVVAFDRAWSAWKRERSLLDFADLIDAAITDTDAAPNRPAVLMLDEAQDMSALEMRLATRWADAAEQLVIVGDPDQAIYQWRGADPAVFSAGAAGTERVLADSYRVPPAVHAFAVRWIGQVEDRVAVEYRPRQLHPQEDCPDAVARCSATYREPHRLVELVEQGAAAGRSQMILASCGYMLQPIIAEMRARGVPFHNPYRRAHGAWNPLGHVDRLLALLRPDAQTMGEDAAAWSWNDVRLWSEPMRAEAFTRGAKTWIAQRCVADRFGESLRDVQADTDWIVENLAGDDEIMGLAGFDLDWYVSALLESRRSRFEYPVEVARRFGRPALRDEPLVTVGTVHSVKGGEAADVFVVPDLSARAWDDTWVHAAAAPQVFRLFYVAFTRARRSLTILDAATRFAPPLPV